MEKLKPCPFCGDKQPITEPYYYDSYVICQNCGATGPTGDINEAERLWNERQQTCDQLPR
jgi:Lar family restriction alleviation protein